MEGRELEVKRKLMMLDEVESDASNQEMKRKLETKKGEEKS